MEIFPSLNLTGMVHRSRDPTNPRIRYHKSSKPQRTLIGLQGGITGIDGKFNIEVFPGTYDISIEYIGFESFSKRRSGH